MVSRSTVKLGSLYGAKVDSLLLRAFIGYRIHAGDLLQFSKLIRESHAFFPIVFRASPRTGVMFGDNTDVCIVFSTSDAL